MNIETTKKNGKQNIKYSNVSINKDIKDVMEHLKSTLRPGASITIEVKQ